MNNQIVDNTPDNLDWHCKAYPLGLLSNRSIDADQVAINIQQRAARITRIDQGIGLDKYRDAAFSIGQPPFRGTDDSRCDRIFQSEGIADRNDRFAKIQAVIFRKIKRWEGLL